MSVVLSELPEHERPRERLLEVGADALSDRELLGVVLRSGRVGESAVDLAGTLLAEFGGLRGLSRARPEELVHVPGVGPAKAAAVLAALNLALRLGRADELPVLRSLADVARAASVSLDGLRRERVIVLVCDAANRLARVVTVSEGSMDQSLVPVREILNAVLRNDGRAFALAHNHPSGDPTPSMADRSATNAVSAAAKTAGVRFLGHVVIGDGGWAGVNAPTLV